MPGSHARDRVNQRQIDVLREELLPRIEFAHRDVGVIAPYRNQVHAIRNAFAPSELDIATIHRFQGREKDAMVISTVDDVITAFSDDTNLLNVAISRAKKQLYLIVSGEEQPSGSTIRDLIEYIRYHNVEIHSRVNSVFDYLYSRYHDRRRAFLKGRKRISQFDSENLMFALIEDVLVENGCRSLGILCHFPLRQLIRDYSLLNEELTRYASHFATHLDFLLYNRVTKQPVLAIEVDGYSFHRPGSIQAERDKKKNRILELYGIPLIRFATTGSGERAVLQEALVGVVGS